MTLVGVFAASFVTALSGALAPGPLLSVTLVESSKRGPLAGFLLITGHSILELGLVVGLVSGLGRLLGNNLVIGITGLMGFVVLIYLGIDMVKGSILGGNVVASGLNGASEKSGNLLVEGVVVSISNPYWFIWWVTIGAAFLSRINKFGVIGIIIFFIGHILADYVWYQIVSLAAHYGVKITGKKALKIVTLICGVFLIALGLYFGYDGFTRLY